MTNQLFRQYLDGEIPIRKPPAPLSPIELTDWQIQALQRIFGQTASAFSTFAETLESAGLITLPLPRDPRARALAAKQRQGHGPPPSASWRGRERSTNYRNQ